MSKKVVLAVALLAVMAACAPKTEPVPPVTIEPAQTGKYK